MTVDFRDLHAWKEAMVLAELVYAATRSLPAEERYGLSSQMRRCSVSVPSCIAEGNARASIPDYLRFLSMAAGSLAELRTQVLLCGRLGFLPSEPALIEQVDVVARLLKALRNSLEARVSEDLLPFPIPHSPFPAPA